MRRLTAPGKVAEFLAINPEKNKYQIAKETGLSYSRVHESIEGSKKEKNPGLEKLGFVKAKVSEKTRAGLDKKTYTLTLKGLVNVLYYRKDVWNKIDTVISQYESLGPLTFRKWNHFVKAGARKFLISRLENTVRAAALLDYVSPERRYGKEAVMVIDRSVLTMEPLLAIQSVSIEKAVSKKEISAWIRALSTDSELASYVRKQNEKLIESTAWALEYQKAYDQALQQNRPELFLSKIKHHAPRSQGGEGKGKKKGGGLK
jgi:hypothetical protein